VIGDDAGPRQSPIALIAASRANQGITRSVDFQANSVLPEPVDVDQAFEFVLAIGDLALVTRKPSSQGGRP